MTSLRAVHQDLCTWESAFHAKAGRCQAAKAETISQAAATKSALSRACLRNLFSSLSEKKRVRKGPLRWLRRGL